MGDSLDAVEALLKKHEDFEKSLAAQEEKVKAVDDMASCLRKGTHYAAADIDSRRREVRGMAAGVYVYMKRDHCGARQASDDSCFSLTLYFLLIPYFSLTYIMHALSINLMSLCTIIVFSSQVLAHHRQLLAQTAARQAQLQASLSLQQFFRDVEEATDWIEEKSKVAGDESYRVSHSLCNTRCSLSGSAPMLSSIPWCCVCVVLCVCVVVCLCGCVVLCVCLCVCTGPQ